MIEEVKFVRYMIVLQNKREDKSCLSLVLGMVLDNYRRNKFNVTLGQEHAMTNESKIKLTTQEVSCLSI